MLITTEVCYTSYKRGVDGFGQIQPYSLFLIATYIHVVEGFCTLMGCGAAEATALFVFLSSTLVCCQPIELIWAFFVS